MDNNYILSVIQKYADEYLKEPKCGLPRSCFEQRSYQMWAVDEILKSIGESKSVSPIAVVEDFVRKMDKFSCSNRKNSVIFSVAHDVAINILDMLLVMK